MAVGGYCVTEVEVGGDPGCRGRAPRATAIGLRCLCLEIHVEIHPALSPAVSRPARPHCLATPGGRGAAAGPGWAHHGNRCHVHNCGWQWGHGGAGRRAASPHLLPAATEPAARRAPVRGWGALTPGWGCGTLTMAGAAGPLTPGWGWGTPHTVLGL